MTIEVTQEDLDLASKFANEKYPYHSVLSEAFARHRQAAYRRAANWIDDNFGADECTAFLDAMRGGKMNRYRLKQDGVVVAATMSLGNEAEREIMHYAAVYSQDGPATVERRAANGKWKVVKR